VWKSVSWALRQIGKRNGKLLREALREARAIERMDTKPSRRIASEVRRELGRVKRRPRQGTSPR
jgi:3-methyladenine DNA glycosylase AlkD